MTILFGLFIDFVNLLFENVFPSKYFCNIWMICFLMCSLNILFIHPRCLSGITGENVRRALLESSFMMVILFKFNTLIDQCFSWELVRRWPILIKSITSFLISNITFIITRSWSFLSSFIFFQSIIYVLLENIFPMHWLIILNN